MNSAIAFVKKWWPSILPGAVAVWSVYGTQVQTEVAKHPEIAAVVAAAYAIFAHLQPSPSAGK